MALMVEVEVQLKAGRAWPLSLQYLNSFIRLSPVTTPAGTMSSRPMIRLGKKDEDMQRYANGNCHQVQHEYEMMMSSFNLALTLPKRQDKSSVRMICYWRFGKWMFCCHCSLTLSWMRWVWCRKRGSLAA